jgi:hypothetical protein
MIRAYIHEDLPTLSLAVSLVEQRDAERPTRILRILKGGDDTTYEWADVPESPREPVEPTLRIGDSEARALLEALARHYGGADDMRALRRDYDDERKRVDALTSALVDVTRRLAEPPREAVAYSAAFPGGVSDEAVTNALRHAKRDGRS